MQRIAATEEVLIERSVGHRVHWGAVFGGFLVTRRMLEMFKKKERKTSADGHGNAKG